MDIYRYYNLYCVVVYVRVDNDIIEKSNTICTYILYCGSNGRIPNILLHNIL